MNTENKVLAKGRREYTIVAEGETLEDVLYAIEEAKRKIEDGYHSGMDSNEMGEFYFESKGDEFE